MKNGRPSSESRIRVYLGLGSNLGDREANLREAVAQIGRLDLEVNRKSSIYETEPVGFADQGWFLNQVISADLPAIQSQKDENQVVERATSFLSNLQEIESEMGRERSITNGPRTIDIDLLLFGDAIIGYSKDDRRQSLIESRIVVPHPRMHERRFVLAPLCEIAPAVVHPVLNKMCEQILDSLVDNSVVRLYAKAE
jgi:2-amino-4-hydroxy-6-hydroxymethyldihydropteridine diphosphokinase